MKAFVGVVGIGSQMDIPIRVPLLCQLLMIADYLEIGILSEMCCAALRITLKGMLDVEKTNMFQLGADEVATFDTEAKKGIYWLRK